MVFGPLDDVRRLEEQKAAKAAEKRRKEELDNLQKFSVLVHALDSGMQLKPAEIFKALEDCNRTSAELYEQLELLDARRQTIAAYHAEPRYRGRDEIDREKREVSKAQQEAYQAWKKKMGQLQTEPVDGAPHPNDGRREWLQESFNRIVWLPSQIEAAISGKPIPRREDEIPEVEGKLDYVDPLAPPPPQNE